MNSNFVAKPEIYTFSPLGRYLLERKETGIEFAYRCGTSPVTVYKAIKGMRVSKRVARNFIAASKKKLSMEDLGYST